MKSVSIKGCIKAFLLLVLLVSAWVIPWEACAGTMELSGSFSFSENNYGNSNIEWTRHWTASLGYYFWGLSEIEFSMQDVLTRTIIQDVEDTTFHDQIYSLDWVQSLTSRASGFQPYVKLGVGQLDRQASGTYVGGVAPPAVYDAFTVVVGGGLRIFIVRAFALKVEATTYLADGVLSTWQNAFSFSAGVSLFF